MNEASPTRRQFLQSAAALAGGAFIRTQIAEAGMLRKAEPSVRKDISSYDPDGPEIAALKRGVAEMRRRSQANPQDPTGWLAQSNIHRDFCSHQNWWFLPWHRAYIYSFEQILRDAAQAPTLTLPYWNWGKDKKLPTAFWGADNPLNDTSREIGPDDMASDEFVGPTVLQDLVTTPDFLSFGSAQATNYRQRVGWSGVEALPHNYIHVFVGGESGNMADPSRAALDPIFWLHHCNVDRLWTEWVKNNPNKMPADTLWRDHSYDFYNAGGQSISFATRQVLNTLDLGYRYDTQVPPPAIHNVLVKSMGRIETSPQNTTITEQAQTFSLNPNATFQQQANKILQQPPSNAPAILRLGVEGISVPTTHQSAVRVFINLPTADANTPISNPHYLTTFTFFEHRGDQHPAGHEAGAMPSFYVDATRVIRRLQTSNLYKSDQPLKVTLVVVPINPQKKIENIRIPFSKLSLTATN